LFYSPDPPFCSILFYFRVLTRLWQHPAHARTRPNRAQRLAEYAARRAELGCLPPSVSLSLSFSPPSAAAVSLPSPSPESNDRAPTPPPRLRACATALCPARVGAALVLGKRRTRPWEHPPRSRGAGANGSVLGGVWEVAEESALHEGARDGDADMDSGCKNREKCACLAALGADKEALKGRVVLCRFGAGERGCVVLPCSLFW
jgi:hypothetical protein